MTTPTAWEIFFRRVLQPTKYFFASQLRAQAGLRHELRRKPSKTRYVLECFPLESSSTGLIIEFAMHVDRESFDTGDTAQRSIKDQLTYSRSIFAAENSIELMNLLIRRARRCEKPRHTGTARRAFSSIRKSINHSAVYNARRIR